MDRDVVLSLSGDVMTGRGIDQILPRPGDPALRESYVRDARRYVQLAEAVHGPIPRPVDPSWPWGESVVVLDAEKPDVRVINLETSVTTSTDFFPGKAVHYRMNPANIACLTVARPDVCTLANNHVLDFGARGLTQTLDVLRDAGLETAGAGRNLQEAGRPAAVRAADGTRVVVFSLGLPSSGIPSTWAATQERAGVALLPEVSEENVTAFTDLVRTRRRPGDLVVVSVHWGPNWGYDVTEDERRLAHALVEGGADVVHGHSSHHPRPVEVHRGKLILYGCGDFIDDYEGIGGHEQYRDDLRLLYLASVAPDDGHLRRLRIVPFQARRMRLERAAARDVAWLRDLLTEISRDVRTGFDLGPDGDLVLRGS